jgi:hypothetical protein
MDPGEVGLNRLSASNCILQKMTVLSSIEQYVQWLGDRISQCSSTLDFVIAFWIMIAFYTLLTLLILNISVWAPHENSKQNISSTFLDICLISFHLLHKQNENVFSTHYLSDIHEHWFFSIKRCTNWYKIAKLTRKM